MAASSSSERAAWSRTHQQDPIAADYGKANEAYIDRCLAIATLNPADFEGCFIPVEALIVTARALGPQTRAVLIAATRAAVLEGADVLKACRLVRDLPDLEAAVLLHRWLVQGEKMPQEAEEEASAKGSEEKEEKEEIEAFKGLVRPSRLRFSQKPKLNN